MDTTEYPPEGQNVECDVIKVLDAWEATTDPVSQPELTNGSVSPAHMKNRNESNTELTCDHADWTSNAYSDGIYVDMGYRYCPKCGNELDNG